jgi:glucosamine--fructose-6-phosphate aminotransferase (isomerizing)
MCGIIGIVGTAPAAPRLIESLKRLEYRGYDSAGVATITASGALDRRRAPGKIRALEEVLAERPLTGTVGIGHTRWATHGPPVEKNAHPQRAGRVAVVHNGIIENFAALKAELRADGRSFESDTDTEVIAQLIDRELGKGLQPLPAFKAALDRLEGAYALGVLIEGADNLVLGARRGSPLVVGYGDGEMFIGSDALAVGPFTTRIAYLDEGDYVAIDHHHAEVFDAAGRPVNRPMVQVSASAALVEKGNYRHFMEKEIHDQPDACQHTLSAYLDPVAGKAKLPAGFSLDGVERIQIVACGTAYLAGLTAKYLFEKVAGLPVDVEIASEFRYRDPALSKSTLALAISQSGETADTLAALKWCKAKGLRTAALVNAHQSTMAREADAMLPTNAGVEVGVASTKAFTAQVCALSALVIAAASARGTIDAAEEARLVAVLMEAPRLIGLALGVEDKVREIAYGLSKARDVLYLGRGLTYALALEGALKLKEISYIHAEGMPAAEMKHGPIALINEGMPVVFLATRGQQYDKVISNIEEVRARGGQIIAVATEGDERIHRYSDHVVYIPDAPEPLQPILSVVPLQLLAYHAAVIRGCNVDKPRNLAKSVTVE